MSPPGFPILSTITFLPLLGVATILLIDKQRVGAIKFMALVTTAFVFLVSLLLFFYFDAQSGGMQFVEEVRWIPELGISYFLGVDGISLFLVLLTTFLSWIAVLASWRDIQERVKEYMAFLLLLETGMVGVFLALDLFLFYVFWEATLIPMAFLVGIWGHERRIYAAVKFFLYTMAGSVLMLLAILATAYFHYQTTGFWSFNLLELRGLGIPLALQNWLFLAFALAFAIKVPLFPFHTWLPDAHVEAPTAGSVILAGILLKMGGYGFLRFAWPLFPQAATSFIPLILALSLIGIVYGALVSWAQKDVKRLVAYSSVSHLGFVVLGIFVMNTQGVAGGILQMVNHGLSTGALFLIVGMLYERRHTREIGQFGGLWKPMPFLSLVLLIVALSSLGLPGLNGFVGEFLVLLGTFQVSPLYAAIAAAGVVLAAVYLLSMLKRVIFGPLENPANQNLPDASPREAAILLAIVALIFFIGIYPQPLLERMEPAVQSLVSEVQAKQGLDLARGE